MRKKGHEPGKNGLGNVIWVLDEPHPRAIRKAFYICDACKESPVGLDGVKTRRFWKVPTLADINEYVPKVAGMGQVLLSGQTYYTIFFLIAPASHFCLRPQVTELPTWLAERWGLAILGFSYGRSMWGSGLNPHQVEVDTTGDVPWMLDAIRGSEVLFGLVERLVICFLDGLCDQVESEAWLADSAVFGAVVCVKLAKVVVQRVRCGPGKKARVVRLYTGVLLHMGARGLLLSVPELVSRETNQAYKASLKPRLARLRRQASQLGLPNAGLPVGAFVDTLGFEGGLKTAVREEFHGIVSSTDPTRALMDSR